MQPVDAAQLGSLTHFMVTGGGEATCERDEEYGDEEGELSLEGERSASWHQRRVAGDGMVLANVVA